MPAPVARAKKALPKKANKTWIGTQTVIIDDGIGRTSLDWNEAVIRMTSARGTIKEPRTGSL